MSDESTPAWRWAVAGVLFTGLAVFMLVTGELWLDKQRTAHITRSGDPFAYWVMVTGAGALGLFSLRKLWQRLTS